MKATFETLLESIGQGDIDRLQARKAGLVAERAKLQDKLAKMNKELHEVELQLVSPLRNAIRAAEPSALSIRKRTSQVRTERIRQELR